MIVLFFPHRIERIIKCWPSVKFSVVKLSISQFAYLRLLVISPVTFKIVTFQPTHWDSLRFWRCCWDKPSKKKTTALMAVVFGVIRNLVSSSAYKICINVFPFDSHHVKVWKPAVCGPVPVLCMACWKCVLGWLWFPCMPNFSHFSGYWIKIRKILLPANSCLWIK